MRLARRNLKRSSCNAVVVLALRRKARFAFHPNRYGLISNRIRIHLVPVESDAGTAFISAAFCGEVFFRNHWHTFCVDPFRHAGPSWIGKLGFGHYQSLWGSCKEE